MSLKIVVLAKQVPDTRNVGPDAMTPEGTVNRAALPAVFNPEDLNALEQALRLKEQFPGSTISVLTEVLTRVMSLPTVRLAVPTLWLPATPCRRLSRRLATMTSSLAAVRPSTVTLLRWVRRLPRS